MTYRLTLLRSTCQVVDDLDGALSLGVLILSLIDSFDSSLQLIDCGCCLQTGKESSNGAESKIGEKCEVGSWLREGVGGNIPQGGQNWSVLAKIGVCWGGRFRPKNSPWVPVRVVWPGLNLP